MALTMTPEEVCELTGVDPVTDTAIVAAKELIYRDSGYTVDEHVDDREVPAASVRLAWAMIAGRVTTGAQNTGGGIVSESQGDYSYSADLSVSEIYDSDPLAGQPRTLLRVPSATVGTVRPGGVLRYW